MGLEMLLPNVSVSKRIRRVKADLQQLLQSEGIGISLVSDSEKLSRSLMDLSSLDYSSWRYLWLLFCGMGQQLSPNYSSYCNGRIAADLEEWLSSYSQQSNRRRRSLPDKSTTPSDTDLEDVEGDEVEGSGVPHVMLLQAPSGCGKTSSVYNAAEALGLGVIEINASQNRSGPAVKKVNKLTTLFIYSPASVAVLRGCPVSQCEPSHLFHESDPVRRGGRRCL